MRRLLVAILLVVATGLLGPAAANQKDPRLDGLFDRLKVTTSELEARALEAEIWRLWSEDDDPAATALLQRGMQSMADQDYGAALTAFDAVVRRRPDFAEGWNKRATLHFLTGDFAASIADIQRTLQLEPRHFGALSGLGEIDLLLGRKEAALKAFEAALRIDPFLAGVKAAVERIKQERAGEPI